ncbi:inositol monophosphatase family protein [Amycolatopsis acidiphila]|uniref:Inositol monophosphatase family protein n=1 Tax=Amycolatopsis acidiphila TaxID=715473 RepID=A0A558ACN1_9PSEU|nr:inositol monophosphatase family protein [Amycolatopsis acidiphila]TVT22024.1 inositol monophosphatase family protein [Amycolatopsis acidiphila]UIJ63658.1 inositol monophosphatase family protein [Amycolatopsis acidiphila]GHG67628.1 inositol monophosphatase [Amycolatopsis acidiphila]
MADHRALLPVAREAVAIAHRIVLARAPVSVTAKAERDLVTDVDLAVEEAVRDFLTRETPEIGVLGEEHGRTGPAGGLWWALDPVDGTANFARGIPLCGTSLGLVEGGRGVLAAIDLPFLGVDYVAVEGYGAYAGDERIQVSGATDLADAVLAIGDFAVGEGAEVKNRARLTLLAELGARAQRIRMLGTAAIDLAWVAQGKLEGSVILANLPWDTLAGVLLVREAGGLVLDGDDTSHTAGSAATIAVCPGLRDEVMAAVRRALATG